MPRNCCHRIMIAPFIALLTLFLGSPGPAGDSAAATGRAGLTLRDLVDGARLRSQRLETLTVHVEFRAYKQPRAGGALVEMDVFNGLKIDVKRKGQMMRIYEVRPPSGSNPHGDVYEAAWNGEKLTTLRTDSDKPVQGRFNGLVTAGWSTGIFHTIGYPTIIDEVVFDFRVPLFRVLERGSWQLIGRERVGGFDAYHISGANVEPLNASLDVWLDPEHDFAPVRMRAVSHVGGAKLVQALDSVQLSLCDNVWVISSAEITKDNPIASPNEIYVEKDTLSEYRVGPAIGDEEFVIDFPRYTREFDDIQKKSLIVGVGEHSISPNGGVALIDSDGRVIDDPLAPNSGYRVRSFSWISLSVLFTSLAAYVVFRIKRRQTMVR